LALAISFAYAVVTIDTKDEQKIDAERRYEQIRNKPVPTVTQTVKVTLPPKTLPPKTVEVTVRVTERASRSNAKRTPNRTRISSSGRPTGLWLELAKCESGANLTRNSGNGYYGAYQFSQSTWEGFLGTQYSPTPLGASWAEQTFIAYRIWLHPKQGWANGFPGCGAKMGYPTMPQVAKP
jgi:hypothetical protein